MAKALHLVKAPAMAKEAASREGARDSASTAEMDDRLFNQLTRIYRAYDKNGDENVTFEEWLAMKNGEMTRRPPRS